MTSVEANRAAAEGIRGICPDAVIVQVPVSDGGEGRTAYQGHREPFVGIKDFLLKIRL